METLREQVETALTVRPVLSRDRLMLEAAVLPAAPEAVTFAVHFQDVDVGVETGQQRSGQPLRAEVLVPPVEEDVGGHHYGAPLVALAEDLEQESPAKCRASSLVSV